MGRRFLARAAVGLLASLSLIGLVGFADSSTPLASERPGAEIALQATSTSGATASPADLDRSAAIMRNRLVRLGIHGSVTHKAGSQQITIRLENISAPAARNEAQAIAQTGRLEFYDLTPALLPPSIDANQNPVPATSLYNLLAQAKQGPAGSASSFYLFDASSKKTIAGPADTLKQLAADDQAKTSEKTRMRTRFAT